MSEKIFDFNFWFYSCRSLVSLKVSLNKMKPFLPSIIVKTFEGFSDESNLGSCEAKNPYGKKVHKNLENLKVKSKR